MVAPADCVKPVSNEPGRKRFKVAGLEIASSVETRMTRALANPASPPRTTWPNS
jgi:hypothetical protein